MAYYPVPVRQGVVLARASFRPHLAVTPLPLRNGSDSLDRRGLPPPRAGTCPAYKSLLRLLSSLRRLICVLGGDGGESNSPSNVVSYDVLLTRTAVIQPS